MPLSQRLLIVLALGFSIARPIEAQVATGTPPFGSFDGGPDIINLANLNGHLDVPVMNKPGRGINFTYDLVYDTAIWYLSTVNGANTWTPVYNLGWSAATQSGIGYISYTATTTPWCQFGNQYYGQQTAFSNWVYYDPWGVPHFFGITTYYYQGSPARCANSGTSTTATGVSVGYTLSVTGSYVNSLTGANGKKVVAPVLVGTGAASFTDRNGNEITVNGSGQFFDTLNSSVAVLTVSGSGTPSSPITFTYVAPSGGNTSYTMNYTNYTVATNFGVGGVGEYKSSAAVPLVTSVVLPDGSSYSFQYEATPGTCTPYSGTSCSTARLTKVTLPTGGIITYVYSGGNHGILSDGSTATLTRTTPDGTWTYAQTKGSGSASQTVVTDAAGDVTTIQFQSIYETQRVVTDVHSGTLATTNTCYNGTSIPCTATAIFPPITQRNVSTKLAGGSLTDLHAQYFDGYGDLKEQDDYDYGAGSNGGLLKKVIVTYASLGNITAFPQTVTVCNGTGTSSSCTGPSGSSTGTVVSQTNYNYDQGTPQPTTNTPQHTSITGSRGNLTSVNFYTSGSSYLTKSMTYWDTGTVNTATDANGGVTTYKYPDATSTCGNAFPTGVTEAISTLTQSYVWNCTGGVQTSATDENKQTTSTTYNDPYFWRPANVIFPDGGQTSWTYNSQNTVTTTARIISSQSTVSTVTLDGLGRTSQTQLTSDPDCSTGDTVQVTYDSLGRLYTVSNAYCSINDPSYGLTTYAYDALGRPTQVMNPDGSKRLASYTGRAIQTQDEGNGTRPVTRVSQIDALGRLVYVCEVSGTTLVGNGGTPAACGLDIAATGFLTTYQFDPLGNVLNVSQNGLNPRTFTYDWLSRMLTAANPETGTISYVYDQNATCVAPASFPGQLVSRTDARGIRTCFQYDGLSRITEKNYSDATPTATYGYDNPNAWGRTLTNTFGRMVTAGTTDSTGHGQGEVFSYDPMGRVVRDEQCIYVGLGGCKAAFATYNLYGSLASFTDVTSTQLTYGYNSAARLNSVTSSLSDTNHPGTLMSSFQYNALGLPNTDSVGTSGITDHFGYTNRGWMSSYWACSVPGSTCTASQLIYTFNMTPSQGGLGYAPNGNIVYAGDWVNGNWTYSYDDFNRILTASCAANGNCPGSQSALGFRYGLDRYGNRWQQSLTAGNGATSNLSFDTNNHITSSFSCSSPNPFCYDGAGNLLNDGLHTYTYDAENRVTQVDGGNTASYTYDAQGRRVSKVSAAGTVDYFYDMSNRQSVEINPTGYPLRIEIYAASRHLGTYLPGTTQFSFTDWLGTERVRTSVTGVIVEKCQSAPYGDMQYCTNTDASPLHFTGDERDVETNLDHTDFRQYSSSFGRWMSPDPAGLAAVDPTNPQSWNRYAYVLNNPLAYIDPTGLCDPNTICIDVVFCNGVNTNAPECIPVTQQPWLTTTNFACLFWGGCGGNSPNPPQGGGGSGSGGGSSGNSFVSKLLSTIKSNYCKAIPSGSVTGVNGSTGGIGGVPGSLEVVVNYNSGQVSVFASGGVSVGWQGGAQGSAFTGYVYGLKNDNSNYSGGFTTISGGAGLGGFISHSSGGPNAPTPSGNVWAFGPSIGGSIITGFTGSVSATNYTQLLNLPPQAFPSVPTISPTGPGDALMYLLRRPCQ
jgi:RHS repeat-associated protein